MPPHTAAAIDWPATPGPARRAAFEEPVPVRDVTPPGRLRTGNRLLIVMLFWAALAASVELWWLNTPTGSITDRAGMCIAAGRITGMVAGFILLVEILTMARIRWIDSWFGAHELLTWHRSLGILLVVLAPAHGVLLVLGYAAASGNPLTRQTWSMLTTMQDMVSATVATGILVVVGALAVRTIRRWMPYELWHAVHASLYLVLLLGYGHEFALGAELIKPGFARWYWYALHILVGCCLIWGRVVQPVVLNARHRFRVVRVTHEGPGWVSIYVTGANLDRLKVEAGQYFRWRFLTHGCWWQAHPFSISSAPNGRWIRVTIKAIGGHTELLQDMDEGVRVILTGPSGTFTPKQRMREKALLIAGGSGIAPIVSLLEDLPYGTMLLYRASTEGDLIFRRELEQMARQRGAQIYFVLGSRNDKCPRRAFSPDGMVELIPDILERDVYLCGPQGLIKTSLTTLRKLGVSRSQVHLDPFEF